MRTVSTTRRSWLESFVENFDDENPQVQLQLLTAIVKLFLKRPEDAKDLVGGVLNQATSNADNPDLRDRGVCVLEVVVH